MLPIGILSSAFQRCAGAIFAMMENDGRSDWPVLKVLILEVLPEAEGEG